MFGWPQADWKVGEFFFIRLREIAHEIRNLHWDDSPHEFQ
jgi:hypothetical protein